MMHLLKLKASGDTRDETDFIVSSIFEALAKVRPPGKAVCAAPAFAVKRFKADVVCGWNATAHSVAVWRLGSSSFAEHARRH
jgi:hypothetical protein